jgi:hypothetical protein
VNLLNPGPMRTKMRANAFPGEDPESLPPPEDIAPLIVEMLSAHYAKNGELISFRSHRGNNPPLEGGSNE